MKISKDTQEIIFLEYVNSKKSITQFVIDTQKKHGLRRAQLAEIVRRKKLENYPGLGSKKVWSIEKKNKH